MIFEVQEAVFIEAAYVSGDAKMSVSLTSGARGGALSPSTVQALVGVPGGLFVKHRNCWNFVSWANVKSARLAAVPTDIEAFAAAVGQSGQGEAPGSYLRQGPAAAATPVAAAAPAPAPARRGRPPKAPPAPVVQESVDDLLGGEAPPAGPPLRDAMGVLVSAQPKDGPKITCSACGWTFVQGSNHVCQKV